MAIKEQNQASRFERRWPVAVTILVVVGLLALMPGRIQTVSGLASLRYGNSSSGTDGLGRSNGRERTDVSVPSAQSRSSSFCLRGLEPW